MNEIKVRTSALWLSLHYLRSFLLGCILFGLLDYFCLYRMHRLAGLLAGGAVLLVFLFVWLYNVLLNRTDLHFTSEGVFVDGYKHNSYKISPLLPEDCLFLQSFTEKAFGVGRIKVKNTRFYFIGVPRYAQIRKFVEENYGKGENDTDPA